MGRVPGADAPVETGQTPGREAPPAAGPTVPEAPAVVTVPAFALPPPPGSESAPEKGEKESWWKTPLAGESRGKIAGWIAQGDVVLHRKIATATNYSPWELSEEEKQWDQDLFEMVLPTLPPKWVAVIIIVLLRGVSESTRVMGWMKTVQAEKAAKEGKKNP